MTVDIWRKWCN